MLEAGYEKTKEKFESLKKLPPYELKMLKLNKKIEYETKKLDDRTARYFSSMLFLILLMIVLTRPMLGLSSFYIITLMMIALGLLICGSVWLYIRSRQSVKAYRIVLLIELIEEKVEL